MKKLAIFLVLVLSISAFTSKEVSVKNSTGNLFGTLLTPDKPTDTIALFISGSGPTDRDGNQPNLQNNSLKLLAESLTNNGISTLRFDKRVSGKSIGAFDGKEENLTFQNFIDDAQLFLNYIKSLKTYKNIVVIGHSEGALIGLKLSYDSSVTKYISLAGVGKNAADILNTQIKDNSPQLSSITEPIIAKLRKGELVPNTPPYLASLFRDSVQPYLISWFKLEPTQIITELKIPILIIQGTSDLQVSVENAKLLNAANSNSKIVLIDNMNHILKTVSNQNDNYASYSNPNLPINEKLVDEITKFIK